MIDDKSIFRKRRQSASYFYSLTTKKKQNIGNQLFRPIELLNSRKSNVIGEILREQIGAEAFHVPSSSHTMVGGPTRRFPHIQVKEARPPTVLFCSKICSFGLDSIISGQSIGSQRGTSLDHLPKMGNQFFFQ